jgi:hypothetical protein
LVTTLSRGNIELNMDDFSKLSAVEILPANVVDGKVEGAEKTYHLQRPDGSFIAVQEREAWDILNGRTSIIGFRHNIPKLVGVSNGQIFQKAAMEAQVLIRQGKLEEAKAMLKKGQEDERASGVGKVEMPRNFDTIDRRGNPIKMSDLR